MYEYKATVVKIVDGDTVDVDVDLGWNVIIRGSSGRIRLFGVDTPESRTRDKTEKKFGLLAKKFVEAFMPVGTKVILKTHEKGKYGRYLGDFKVGRKWLCKELLKHHHAVEYTGQNKATIKKAHLANRELVIKNATKEN